MEKKKGKSIVHRRMVLIVPVLLVFCILGTVIFFISKRITNEMSESAIGNLNESLELLGNTLETILRNEAKFQELIAQELVQRIRMNSSDHTKETI